MMMTQTEVCRRLHDLVDQLAAMPPDMWEIGHVIMRITIRSREDDDGLTLVAGTERADDDE